MNFLSLNLIMKREFSKLFSVGLLPKFVKRKKIPILFNHINCESHKG